MHASYLHSVVPRRPMAATCWRIVRLIRSTKAVLSCPPGRLARSIPSESPLAVLPSPILRRLSRPRSAWRRGALAGLVRAVGTAWPSARGGGGADGGRARGGSENAVYFSYPAIGRVNPMPGWEPYALDVVPDCWPTE